MQPSARSRVGVYVVAWAVSACGMSPSSGPPVTGPVVVVIAPTIASIPSGGAQSFSATVTGSSDSTVTWSIEEGAPGGSIASSGMYVAPMTPGTYHVVATSNA